MNAIFYHNDTLVNRISYWHYVVFLCTLPFDFFYNQLVLLSLGLHTLIHCTKASWQQLWHRTPWMVMLPFVCGAIGIVYSADRGEGGRLLERQVGMLVFPLIMGLNTLDLSRYRKALLHWFGIAVVLTILYLYIDAMRILLFYQLPLRQLITPAFMNHDFALPIGLHATYLSLYAALSFLVFLYYLLRKPTIGYRVLYSIALVVLAAGILQLSSRAVGIALLCILNGCLPFMMFTGRKRWQIFATGILLTGLFLWLLSGRTTFRERYFTELKKDVTDQRENDALTDPRMTRWKLAVAIIRQAPLLGHGTGSEVRLLKAAYFDHALYSSYLNAFNAHSQYLSIWIKTGLWGILLYVWLLYSGIRRAIRRHDFFLMVFFLMIAIVGFGENLLDVNKGIFFYAFFGGFFWPGSNEETGNRNHFVSDTTIK
jgi:O-antigen ligase